VTEPRTHYQISLTSRQAVGVFAALLVALGVAYFLGLMTGLSRRGAPEPAPAESAASLAPTPAPAQAAASDALPPVETAVPTAAAGVARVAATHPPAEPTSPPTIQPFDDGSSEEAAAPLVEAYPGKSPPAAQSGTAKPGAGKYWVQVASLTSKQEAGALSGRPPGGNRRRETSRPAHAPAVRFDVLEVEHDHEPLATRSEVLELPVTRSRYRTFQARADGPQ